MDELKELAKGDDRILFTGFVQGAMLDELYSNAYIYTLPSDLEGMPLSLLEAMSYGNCCLVSDIPECAEVVEDNDPVPDAIESGLVDESFVRCNGRLGHLGNGERRKTADDRVHRECDPDDAVHRDGDVDV